MEDGKKNSAWRVQVENFRIMVRRGLAMRDLVKKIIICVGIAVVVFVFPVKIGNSEIKVKGITLDDAIRYVAKKYYDDYKLIKAIVFVESRNGKFLIGGKDKHWKYRSYGVMQIRLNTARFVGKIYKLHWLNDMSDKRLRDVLIRDHVANVMIGTLYLKYLLARVQGDVVKAVRAYNKGLAGKVNNDVYVVKVMSRYYKQAGFCNERAILRSM
jgi:soluble lytic murein transglycosylase-like protein